MNTRPAARAATLALALSLVGASALADPVTWNIAGTVTQVNFDPIDPTGGRLPVGAPLYTYLNFDTATPDAVADPHVGSYSLSGFPYGMAAVVGSVVMPVMHTINIAIVDGVGGGPDQYSVFASEGLPDGASDYFSFSMLLQDDSGTAFDGDALPATLPDFSRFSVRQFNLSGQYTAIDSTFYQYEILGVVHVPEPATLGLAALALLGAHAAGRRRMAARADREPRP